MTSVHWELSTLYEIGRILSDSPEFPDLVNTITRAAIAFGNADASWLAVCDEAEGRLEYVANHNLSSKSVEDLSSDITAWYPETDTEALKTAILTDLSSNSVLGRVGERESLKAAVLIPITYNEKLTGLLVVFWGRSSRPISDYIEPVFILTNQAGAAIVNSRLLSEARHRTAAMDAVFNVTQMIGASTRMSYVLNVVMDEANRLIGTDRSTIRLLDPNTQQLVVRAARGFSKRTLKRIRLKVGQGVMGWVAEHGTPLILNDVRSDHRYAYYPKDAEHISSLISVPLFVEGRTIGVLSVSSTEPKVFTSEDENLLMTLAGQAAISIENARLHEQVRRRLAEQKVLYRMAQELASTADVPSAQKFIVNHLSTSFRAKFGSLRLLDGTGSVLEIGATYSTVGSRSLLAGEDLQLSLEQDDPRRDTPIAFAIREKRICSVSNIFRDRRFPAVREDARVSGYTSLVCVPLIPTDTPIGVLSLYFREARRLQPAEFELLQTAGRTAAIAVQRAILDERLLKEEIFRRAVEEVSHLKTEFLSQVSHELRTPLTSIQGYVKLILAGHTGEMTDLQGEFLNTVSRNTERLIALVNDLLDISRIESGSMELVLESLSLAHAIDRELESLKGQAEERRIAMRMEVADGVPRVHADRHRLGQIISNLLSNAIKYSPQGSVVRVTAAGAGANVLVRVIDSGIGITPEERTKLFQRFYRGQSDTVKRTPGTGLGLSITRHLVEMHGGKVWVESEKDQGSIFSFSIPAVQDGG